MLLDHQQSAGTGNPKDASEIDIESKVKRSYVPVASNTGSSEVRRRCRLCFFTNHSTLHCRKYSKFEDRQCRADELKLSTRCLSKAHAAKECPGVTKGLSFQCIAAMPAIMPCLCVRS